MTNKLIELYHKVLTPPYHKKDFMILGISLLVIFGLPTFMYVAKQQVELRSLAAETPITESETGTFAGDVPMVDDLSASGGKYIRLGTYIAPSVTPTSLPTPTPSGSQLYVSPTGSGTGCTQAAPCSLTTANTLATPGTTIIAASGTYNGNFITTKGGTAGNFITFRSQIKHGATILGNGDTDTMSAVEINHDYIRFQDFTITGATARHGVYINANNVEIIGNHIHTIVQWKTGNTGWKGGAGVQTGQPQMSNILIDSNTIDHIGAPGSTEQLVHGMYIDAHVTNTRVSNNVIHDVEDFALHPYPPTEASGWQFINNTITNTGRGILQSSNGITRNNIVYNTRGTSYDIRGTGNVLSNNFAGGTGTGSGVSGVTYGVNPMFVNAAANDYHLQSGSPAIDGGTALQAPTTDYDGKTRPQGAGFDIGAFEY